jgi:hypothetical protein
MPVTADTDLTTLTIADLNELIDNAGSEVVVDSATYVGINASDEYQWEVTYFSPQANTNVTNHVFIAYDLDGDPFLSIYDLDPEEDLFPDD